jgi:26S proteasome regulatory subunit N7
MTEGSPLDNLPSIPLAQLRQRYSYYRSPSDEAALMSAVREHRMLPWYRDLCHSFDWRPDQSLIAELAASNADELSKLEDHLASARDGRSEEDVRLACQDLALFALRIGDQSESKGRLHTLFVNTRGVGQKIDLVFCQIRTAFFFGEHSTLKDHVDQAQTLVNEGGDWERKNRLKVYEGLTLCLKRNFVGAAQSFISTLSTSAPTELMPIEDFVYRTVVLAVLALNRADFGAKIDHAMEVHAAGDGVCALLSMYHLKYAQFFDALAALETRMKTDIWFARHLSYLIKELRVKVYAQFLEPYEAVDIGKMANSFGVTPQFIEAEMKRFISNRKLNAKIDRVTMTIHTNPPDSRAAKMREALRGGELLVTRLQKLGRILST